MSKLSDSKLYVNRDRRRGPITEKRSEAIGFGQVQRYEKKNAKKKASAAQRKCWAEGKRSVDRVYWTSEMDHTLLCYRKNHTFYQTRTAGAKIIGVSDLCLRNRLKFLTKLTSLSLLKGSLLMPKENNVFTLSDVFYKKFPEKSMKILLGNATNQSMPLLTKITLGDVALQCGSRDAWWCVRLLPNESRRDVIKSILPSIKRILLKQIVPTNEILTNAIVLLERFSWNEFIATQDLRSLSGKISGLKNKTPVSDAIDILVRCSYEMRYEDDVLKIMSILEKIDLLDDQEKNLQVTDICVVFTPIVGVKVLTDLGKLETKNVANKEKIL